MRHILFGTVAAGALAASAVSAQDVLTAVHAFPSTLIYTKSFLEFVDKCERARRRRGADRCARRA
jgi:TRAP-type transport system periplasmic protein